MKRVAIIGLVLILVATSAITVMAAGGPPAGRGNGNNQANSSVNKTQDRQQTRTQDRTDQNGASQRNSRPNGRVNQTGNGMRSPFYLQGTISAIDTTTKTITVTLIHGNAKVKSFIGTDLTLQLSDMTRIYLLTPGQDADSQLDEDTSSGTTGTERDRSSDTSETDESPSARTVIAFDQLAVGQSVAIHGNLAAGVYNATMIKVTIHEPVEESTGD